MDQRKSRRDPECNGFNRPWVNLVLCTDLAAGINCRVDDKAAGIGLISIVTQFKVFAEPIERLVEIVLRSRYSCETACTIPDILAGREVALS